MDHVTINIKWQGKDLAAVVPSTETVAGIKRVLENETSVMFKKQKLLGLKTHEGKNAVDTTTVAELALKPNQKIMLLGTVEKDLEAMAQQEVEPHIQVHDDLDDEFEETPPVDIALRPEVIEKLQRRVQQAIIKTINPCRPGKKCAVFDIDYTIFDLSSVSENPMDLARPHLHEFFTSIYPHYDIIIWSATSMKWIDVKLKELGVTSHPDYKITACMDYTAMVTVDAPGHSKTKRIFDCKPLQVLWERFSEFYNPKNTIMCDDLKRNYVLNPQNGLVIRPFKKANTSGKNDIELFGLENYFLKIAELETLEDLDHSRWEKYLRKKE